MGDRGTVEVRQYKKSVYLYTHWHGSELPKILKKALGRKQRWDDGAYLARIIFCTMLNGDMDGETGFGISAGPCDGAEYVVDVDKQKVGANGLLVSFTDFIK